MSVHWRRTNKTIPIIDRQQEYRNKKPVPVTVPANKDQGILPRNGV